MNAKTWAMALVALTGWSAAQAGVTVKFVEPSTFADIKGSAGFQDLDILKDVEAHLVQQAGKRLSGQDLFIEVTDLDLAGDVRPIGRWMQSLRVIKPLYSPAMDLRFELREGGKVVRSGQVHLRDMSFQNAINPYASGDPLRYERRMMDRWLDEEFGHKLAAASQ